MTKKKIREYLINKEMSVGELSRFLVSKGYYDITYDFKDYGGLLDSGKLIFHKFGADEKITIFYDVTIRADIRKAYILASYIKINKVDYLGIMD